jgi:3-deoxy-D-manno-octulosonic-acid transferase
MAFLYNFLQTFFLVSLLPIWVVLLVFNKRLRKGLVERLGFSEGCKEASYGPSIWVHAASLGEVKVSVPICEALAKRFPTHEMVFSASTPVGKKQARLAIKNAKKIFLLPLDFIWVVCPVVRKLHPRFFLVAETELWPNLFFCLRSRDVRIALFNGRISDRSFKRYKMFRFFFRRVLACVDLFLVQTEEDAQRMENLGAPVNRVRVTGNVKFDATYTPLERREILELRAMLHMREEDIVWVAGSVHPEEFPILIEAYLKLRSLSPQTKWIVIPRHLYAFTQFEEALKVRGLSYAIWNGKEQVPESWEILLVNALGQLIRLYQLGFAAFVGGSLVPIGGHNPLEPLRYGIPTCFGPCMENFREIQSITVREKVAFEVSNAEELSGLLKDFLEKPEWCGEIHGRCLQMFNKYQGATQRSIQELETWMSRDVSFK